MADSAAERARTAGERRGPNGELSAWSDALLGGVAMGYAALIAFLTVIRREPEAVRRALSAE